MKTGDTFWLLDESNVEHLYIIISDTEENSDQVIAVNVSTYNDPVFQDSSCILEPDEHPAINRKSHIHFEGARDFPNEGLENALRGNHIRADRRASFKLIEKIRKAIPNARISFKVLQFLIDQGVVEEE